MSATPDAKLAKIAARQFGVFTFDQALGCGFSPEQVRYRVSTGRWLRLHRGVFAIAGTRGSLERGALAAALASGGLVAHRTAGRLWSYDAVPLCGPEVLVTGRGTRRIDGIKIRQAVHLSRQDVSKLGVIPITSPVRTLIDLASVLDDDDFEDAFDSALRRHVKLHQIERRLLGDLRGLRGVAQIRRLVATRRDQQHSGSRRENAVRRQLVRAGLPEPARQYVINDDDGKFVARPDLAYPDAKVYIEYDGGHHATPEQLDADNERQNKLSELGWLPLRFTKGSFANVDQRIVRRVRSTLSRVTGDSSR